MCVHACVGGSVCEWCECVHACLGVCIIIQIYKN